MLFLAGVLFFALEAVEQEDTEQRDDYQPEVIDVIAGKKLAAAYPCHHGEIDGKHDADKGRATRTFHISVGSGYTLNSDSSGLKFPAVRCS